MDCKAWWLMDDRKDPFWSHVEAKGVRGAGARERNGATKGGSDRAMDMAREYPHHLRMAP